MLHRRKFFRAPLVRFVVESRMRLSLFQATLFFDKSVAVRVASQERGAAVARLRAGAAESSFCEKPISDEPRENQHDELLGPPPMQGGGSGWPAWSSPSG